MKYHCSICGKEISKKSYLNENRSSVNSDNEELICLSCIKEADPIAYLFVLQSIKERLSEELRIKEGKIACKDNKELYNNNLGKKSKVSSNKIPA